jgi:hypothetical protein
MPFRRGRAEWTAGGILRGAATGATFGSMIPGIGTTIGAGIGALGGLLGFGTSASPEEIRMRRAAELRRALAEMREGQVREGTEQILGQVRGMQAQASMSAARRAAAEGRTDTGPLMATPTAQIAREGSQALASLRRNIAQQFDPLMAELEFGVAARPIPQPFGEQLFDWVTDIGSQYFQWDQAQERLNLLNGGQGMANQGATRPGLIPANFGQVTPPVRTGVGKWQLP